MMILKPLERASQEGRLAVKREAVCSSQSIANKGHMHGKVEGSASTAGHGAHLHVLSHENTKDIIGTFYMWYETIM